MATPHLTPEPSDHIEPVDPPDTTIERNDNGTVATPEAARKLVRARWATEQAVRDDLTALFETIDMAEGLELLAHMREMCELAARAIEKRRTEETANTACVICGVTKAQMGNKNWRMVTSHRDPKTGTMFTDYFCSDMCVIEKNRQKYGVAAMSDRGMSGGKTPIMKHQESVQATAAKLETPRQKQKTAKLAKDLAKKGQ